jgi:hypothetical protein
MFHFIGDLRGWKDWPIRSCLVSLGSVQDSSEKESLTGAFPAGALRVRQFDVSRHCSWQALDFIGHLYHQEAQSCERQFADDALLTFRAEHAKPVIDAFFAWLTRTLREQVLPSLIPLPKVKCCPN